MQGLGSWPLVAKQNSPVKMRRKAPTINKLKAYFDLDNNARSYTELPHDVALRQQSSRQDISSYASAGRPAWEEMMNYNRNHVCVQKSLLKSKGGDG